MWWMMRATPPEASDESPRPLNPPASEGATCPCMAAPAAAPTAVDGVAGSVPSPAPAEAASTTSRRVRRASWARCRCGCCTPSVGKRSRRRSLRTSKLPPPLPPPPLPPSPAVMLWKAAERRLPCASSARHAALATGASTVSTAAAATKSAAKNRASVAAPPARQRPPERAEGRGARALAHGCMRLAPFGACFVVLSESEHKRALQRTPSLRK